jgi:hypothetical protein
MSNRKVWPEVINVPSYIGKHKLSNGDQPCCAVGHSRCEFWLLNGKTLTESSVYTIPTKFRESYNLWYNLYIKLYSALCQCVQEVADADVIVSNHVESINDNLSTAWRRRLYLLTWAKLGYTEGMPKEVLELLELNTVRKVNADS